MQKLTLSRFHAWFLPSWIEPLKLSAPMRKARRALLNLTESEKKACLEELDVMREEMADVDEKGEKIALLKQNDKVRQWSISGRNTMLLEQRFLQHLFTPFTVDVLPEVAAQIPVMAEMIEKLLNESELDVVNENQMNNLVEILHGRLDLLEKAKEVAATAEKSIEDNKAVVEENKKAEAAQSAGAGKKQGHVEGKKGKKAV